MKFYRTFTTSTTTIYSILLVATVGWWCQVCELPVAVMLVHADEVMTPVSSPINDLFSGLLPSIPTTPNVPTTTTTTSPAPMTTTMVPITLSPSDGNVTLTLSPSMSLTNVTTAVPSALTNETAAPTIFTNGTVTYDCTLAEEGIDIRGDQTLLLRLIINPVNETVTVQLEYVGEAWLSFGFSTSFAMVPNVAVIGLPDVGTVLKYNMTSKLLDGVTPLSDEQQTLTDISITQENGITILTYTQPLNEVGEVPVLANEQNTYIWANGFSNPLNIHDSMSRGGAFTMINECLKIGETFSPTVPPTITPTASPVTRMPVVAEAPTEPVITDGLDCSFQNPIDVVGDGAVILSQAINPINETITIQLEYYGNAWLSFGFSNTLLMVPNIAVIGLPEEGTVLKYDMVSRALEGVTPLSDDQQTLMDESITQKDGLTTLKFTQYLDDLVDVPVIAGPMTYIWAYGIGNPLATSHSLKGRGGTTSTFTECLKVGETAAPIPEATEPPTASPTVLAKDDGSGIIDLGNGRVQRSLSLTGKGTGNGIDLTFITDSMKETLTIEMVYAGIGYVSVAFSHDLLMPDSLAVMALPGDEAGIPQKWDMAAAKTLEAVTLAPTERQTLTDAKYYQNDTHTGMIFTKKFVEENEQEIFLSGTNYILWAVGGDNSFSLHTGRGGFPIDFSSTESSGSIESVNLSPNKNWWIVHGVFLAVSWVILVPIAIAASILKSYLSAMPAGFWFRTHRNLNALAVLFTIFGFGISVYLIADETGGSEAKHFNTMQHHKIGLAVFLFAFIQAVSGFFRPHLPHKPDPIEEEEGDDDENVEEGAEEQVKAPAKHDHHHELRKSPQRIFFEYQHRILGAISVILGWFNCGSGFDAYNVRFDGPELNAALWAVVGTIIIVTVILAVIDRTIRQRS